MCHIVSSTKKLKKYSLNIWNLYLIFKYLKPIIQFIMNHFLQLGYLPVNFLFLRTHVQTCISCMFPPLYLALCGFPLLFLSIKHFLILQVLSFLGSLLRCFHPLSFLICNLFWMLEYYSWKGLIVQSSTWM